MADPKEHQPEGTTDQILEEVVAQTDEKDREGRPRLPRFLLWILLSAAIASLLIVLPYFAKFGGAWAVRLDDWGLAGDYIGGTLSAVFAFLALLVLSWSVHLQLEELKRTTALLDEQSKEAKRQNAKDTFFRIFQLHYNNVDSLASNGMKGREVLFKASLYLMREMDLGGDLGERAKGAYEKVYTDLKYGNALGHYFRTYYNLIRFVDESELLQEDIFKRLVRAPLSEDEVTIMFFNGLSKRGEKMKPFIEKYELLFHIDPKFDAWPEVKALYPIKAFGITPK